MSAKNPVTIVPALATSITQSNSSILVAPLEAVLCIIQNPLTNIDQGIDIAEVLYVDITGPCSIGSATTIKLVPGEIFISPPNLKYGLWALASTVGHNFAAVLSLGYIQPFQALSDGFPPSGPTGLLDVIPAYLYQEYSDDDDLQAINNAQNDYQQRYADGFNNIDLPIYTESQITGNLLDWVANGIYGYQRPALATGIYNYLGPLNTAYFDQIFPNEFIRTPRGPVTLANDDIYKRALTWHFYKGDGKYFNVKWLKRRVARFIYGKNGIDPTDQTVTMNQISITFGPNREVTIRFVLNIRTLTTAAVCNNKGFYCNNMYPNQMNSNYTRLPALPSMVDFQQSVYSGALELPFQFTYQVQIG